ncbi:MAG: hypothetical protein ACOX8H_11000 [Ruminococcus sp.]|jgi:hypothetical protein
MKAPGKSLLKVVGIILIVFSVFGLLGTVLNFFVASSMTAEMEAMLASTGYSAEDVMAGSVWGLISSVIWLIAGIIGVKNCNKTSKGKICVILGGLMLVEILAEAVYSLMGGQFAILGTVINLILPLLYFWGAMKNFQADTAAAAPSPVDGVADILEVSSDKMQQTSQRKDEDQ